MKAESRLAAAYLAAHPGEAVHCFEGADAATCAAVLDMTPPSVVAGALERMPPAEAASVLQGLPVERTREILVELSLAGAVLLLRCLPSAERTRWVDAAPDEMARSLRAALVQSEGSAASMMDSNVFALPQESTAEEAIRRARRRSRKTGNYLYVVDPGRRLVGAVSLSQLMLASPDAELATLMRSSVVRISAQAGVEAILSHEGWRELHAIPVVDSGGVLLGILRRETYERLRQERSGDGAGGRGGLGMALAELAWTAMVSTVDQVAHSFRPEAAERQTGRER